MVHGLQETLSSVQEVNVLFGKEMVTIKRVNLTEYFADQAFAMTSWSNKNMLVNLKLILNMYHPTLLKGVQICCDLRVQDPDFNKGHGQKFYDAFERAIKRGDFK